MKTKLYLTIPLLILIVGQAFANGNKKDRLINFRDSKSIKNERPVLIAHRGGVVTANTPECSLASIRLAKDQNYTMVELDIRESKDDVPVVFHDRNMEKACGINKSIIELNAEEIIETSYLNTTEKVSLLDEALKLCSTLKLGVMLDIKAKGDEAFFQKIIKLINKYGLENSCITINGAPEVRKYLKGIVLLTVSGTEFKKVEQGETCDLSNKFWFGLPHQLPSDMVKKLQDNGAYVIPAINTFRYPADGHYELADKDIKRLNKAGVDGYQIDSVYGPLFFK